MSYAAAIEQLNAMAPELYAKPGQPRRKFSLDEIRILLGALGDPQKLVLPARNATMADFVSLLQRAVLDRPVVDKTGLTGRYDFDLEWAPDETQFGGEVPVAPADAQSPPFFTAIEQQLGLRLEATRGPIAALVVDGAERPSAN